MYGYVGWGPNQGTDPLGLCAFGLPCPEELKRAAQFSDDVRDDFAKGMLSPQNLGRNLQRGLGGLLGTGRFVGKTALGLGSLALDTGPLAGVVPGANERNLARAKGIADFARHPIDTVANSHADALARIEAHEAKGEYIQSGIEGGEMGSADAAAVIGTAAAARGLSRLTGATDMSFLGEATTQGLNEALVAPKGVPWSPLTRAPWTEFRRTHGLSGKADARIVDDLTASMKNQGWKGDPIAVLEHGGSKYILDGHHRWVAAQRAGVEIPYRSVAEAELSAFGYRSVDEVIWAASAAGPIKLPRNRTKGASVK
jgi:hypothetical protein